MLDQELVFSPTDFVAIANQTLEYAFGISRIEGEVANFRISKNKWVYFDIKDEFSKVSCFASVYALSMPIENGMVVKISGTPRLHPQFGFSVTCQSIVPSGEGTIKKAFDLLKAKLEKEGLFDETRKRSIPTIPVAIGVITSQESAAYADFIKIINARWPFLHVTVFDIQVQGEQASNQIVAAISDANQHADQLDMIVITRGGGSADDLQAFNDEHVVRAVAASRIPTIVAIGHEIDISLAELASDLRASTPSNAAELITPNVRDELRRAQDVRKTFTAHLRSIIATIELDTKNAFRQLGESIIAFVEAEISSLQAKKSLLEAYNPAQVLRRGYSIVAKEGSIVKSVHGLRVHDTVTTTVNDGSFDAQIVTIHKKEA